jgi:hypothetical protein
MTLCDNGGNKGDTGTGFWGRGLLEEGQDPSPCSVSRRAIMERDVSIIAGKPTRARRMSDPGCRMASLVSDKPDEPPSSTARGCQGEGESDLFFIGSTIWQAAPCLNEQQVRVTLQGTRVYKILQARNSLGGDGDLEI